MDDTTPASVHGIPNVRLRQSTLRRVTPVRRRAGTRGACRCGAPSAENGGRIEFSSGELA
eukprot:7950932-Pyramimonas_sp.AAC.1